MENEMERGPHKVFAYIGFYTGIVGIALSWAFALGCVIGVVGLIFSCLGKKSTSKENLAKKGCALNAVAICLGFLLTIIWMIFILFSFGQSVGEI